MYQKDVVRSNKGMKISGVPDDTARGVRARARRGGHHATSWCSTGVPCRAARRIKTPRNRVIPFFKDTTLSVAYIARRLAFLAGATHGDAKTR